MIYMKRISIFLIVVALIAGMVGCGGCGGYTRPSKNLEIRTWYDLNAVRYNLAGNHTLMNNLDSTTPGYKELASPEANDGKGWQPIGGDTTRGGVSTSSIFSGTFDGQGYEIRDLFINRPQEWFAGLFGAACGSIQRLGVVNVCVTGNDCAGSLMGVAWEFWLGVWH